MHAFTFPSFQLFLSPLNCSFRPSDLINVTSEMIDHSINLCFQMNLFHVTFLPSHRRHWMSFIFLFSSHHLLSLFIFCLTPFQPPFLQFSFSFNKTQECVSRQQRRRDILRLFMLQHYQSQRRNWCVHTYAMGMEWEIENMCVRYNNLVHQIDISPGRVVYTHSYTCIYTNILDYVAIIFLWHHNNKNLFNRWIIQNNEKIQMFSSCLCASVPLGNILQAFWLELKLFFFFCVLQNSKQIAKKLKKLKKNFVFCFFLIKAIFFFLLISFFFIKNNIFPHSAHSKIIFRIFSQHNSSLLCSKFLTSRNYVL